MSFAWRVCLGRCRPYLLATQGHVPVRSRCAELAACGDLKLIGDDLGGLDGCLLSHRGGKELKQGLSRRVVTRGAYRLVWTCLEMVPGTS